MNSNPRWIDRTPLSDCDKVSHHLVTFALSRRSTMSSSTESGDQAKDESQTREMFDAFGLRVDSIGLLPELPLPPASHGSSIHKDDRRRFLVATAPNILGRQRR